MELCLSAYGNSNNLNFLSSLLVVSTKVGGVPEILPEDMMILAEPSVSDVIEKVQIAIERHKKGEKKDPIQMHEQIKEMYNWRDIAKRTEVVYNRVIEINDQTHNGIGEKLIKFRRCGYFGYYFMAFIYFLDFILISFLEIINPAAKIDRAIDSSDYKRQTIGSA